MAEGYFSRMSKGDKNEYGKFIEIVAPWVEKYKKQKNLELEFRLGYYNEIEGSFDTNIGQSFFKLIKEKLEDSDLKAEKGIYHDEFDSNGNRKTQHDNKVILIKKTKLCVIDFKFVGTPFDLRVSFATENVVKKFGPEITMKRKKIRNSYDFEGWRYDVTEIDGGQSENSYEFELEASGENYKKSKNRNVREDEVVYNFLHDAAVKISDICKMCEDEEGQKSLEFIQKKEY